MRAFVNINYKTYKKLLFLPLLSLTLITLQNCNKAAPQYDLEKIITTECWSSPCWGYNAPKIVRNNDDVLWALNMEGSYPKSTAVLFRRDGSNNWAKGNSFDGIYQPGMMLLDSQGRVNIILNYQEEPVRHYRSKDEQNLKDFELISIGNGLADGRGWYIGAAIKDDIIYLSYITLDYDLWFTWKNVKDSVWCPAIKLYDGYPSSLGNHALLYPKIAFYNEQILIMSSHCSDGSVQNTYDKIVLHSIPVDHPVDFTQETVFEGDSGYYSFGFDMVIMDKTVICAFLAGEHKYGPIVDDAVKSGLYVSSKPMDNNVWMLNMVNDGPGCITLGVSQTNKSLYALVTEGSWFSENHSSLKKSDNLGATWQTVLPDLMITHPEITGQYFFQSAQDNSGSSIQSFDLLFSNLHKEKTENDLYNFDLMYMRIAID